MVEISLVQATIALGLVAICVGLSWWQNLKLEVAILVSVGRSVLQLIVLGYVLEIAFSFSNPIATLITLGLFWVMGSMVARNRIDPESNAVLGWVSLAGLVGVGSVLFYIGVGVFSPYPWHNAQFWVPIGGLALGSSLNCIGQAGETYRYQLKQHRLEIETRLSLGARPHQASEPYRLVAIRTALLPQIRLMAIAGLATLPPFLAGGLASGVPPLVAVVQQLLLLIVLLTSSFVSILILVAGLTNLYFDQDDVLSL